MQKHFLKYRKVFTNIVCSPLVLISSNSELVAKYLPNEFEKKIETLEINTKNKSLFQGLYINQEENSFIAENKEIPDNSIVLGAPGKIIGEVQEKHRAMMERAQKSYVRRSVAYKTDLNDVTDNFKY